MPWNGSPTPGIQIGLVNGGAFQAIPAAGSLNVDLRSFPPIFRSASITIQTSGVSNASNSSVSVLVTDFTSGVLNADAYSVKILTQGDSVTFRIPLTPRAATSMGTQIAFQPGATTNLFAKVVLDTVECAQPPPLIYGSLYRSGFLGAPTDPSVPVPQAATFSTGYAAIAAGGSQLIPAPAQGANYIFGWSAYNSAGTNALVSIFFGGIPIWVAPLITPGSGYESPPKKIRTTAAVFMNPNAAAGIQGSIDYAPGP